MKILASIIIISITTFVSSKLLRKYENNHYQVIEKLDEIEIRKYKDLLYTSYTPKNKQDRNNSFRNVADFIFGNNNKNEEISMTTPVVIKSYNNNEMAFIMPEEYTLENIPKPNNNNLNTYIEKGSIKACISYSGYTTKNIENKKTKKLTEILKKYNIEHNNDFELLVYNSPWDVINRKNEIVVSIKYEAESDNYKNIYLGSGCFWCTEAIFENVIGVYNVYSGYTGGEIDNPNYELISTGETNHAEVCKISYDPNIINLENLLEIFFFSHDPTTLNRQGYDIGKQYRSIILFNNSIEEKIISNYINNINAEYFNNKIVTEVKEINKFFLAENYHQDYYKNNRNEQYCRVIIDKKLEDIKKSLSKYYR